MFAQMKGPHRGGLDRPLTRDDKIRLTVIAGIAVAVYIGYWMFLFLMLNPS